MTEIKSKPRKQTKNESITKSITLDIIEGIAQET